MNAGAWARWKMKLSFPRYQFHSAQSASPVSLAPCLAIRRLASQVEPPASKDPSKPKPKAATPLRRSASKSLPIRANPTPTRGDIQTVFTLATAERYALSRLRGHLPPQSRTLHESWWVPKWGPKGKEGEIFIFANGSFVCWGLGEDDAKIFSEKVISIPNVQVGPLKEAETEELEFVTDPNEWVNCRSLDETYGTDCGLCFVTIETPAYKGT